MTSPLSADAVLNRYFLEMRAKVLDVAAAMDRIDRAEGARCAEGDERLNRLRRAIRFLLDDSPDRAQRVLMVFSDPYESSWPRPASRE